MGELTKAGPPGRFLFARCHRGDHHRCRARVANARCGCTCHLGDLQVEHNAVGNRAKELLELLTQVVQPGETVTVVSVRLVADAVVADSCSVTSMAAESVSTWDVGIAIAKVGAEISKAATDG